MYVKNPASNRRALSKSQIDEILETPGLRVRSRNRTQLRTDLVNAESFYFAERFFQTRQAPAEKKKQLKKINKAANSLLSALDIRPSLLKDLKTARSNAHAFLMSTPPQDMYVALQGGAMLRDPEALQLSPMMKTLRPPPGEDFEDLKNYACFNETLSATTIGVAFLAYWATLATEAMPLRAASSKANHQGDKAMNGLIVRLSSIYTKEFERAVGASIDYPNPADAGGPFVRFVQAFCEAMRQNISGEMVKADSKLKRDLSPTGHAIRARLRTLKPM